MSWRLTVMGIAAAVVVCAGKEPKTVPSITITTITCQKATKGLAMGEKILKVCTSNDLTGDDLDSFILGIGSKDEANGFEKVLDTYAGEDVIAMCKFFKGDISNFSGYFLFTMQALGTDHIPLLHGEAVFILPASFLDEPDILSTVLVGARSNSVRPVDPNDSLRIKVSKKLDKWKVCRDEKIIDNIRCDDDELICYAIEVEPSNPSTSVYSLCIKEESGGKNATLISNILVQSLTIDTPVDLVEDTDKVLLTYGYTASRKDVLSKLKIQAIGTEITKTLEFVTYLDKKEIYGVCSGVAAECECNLDPYVIAKQNIKIIVMDVDGDDPIASNIIEFNDFLISGVALGPTVVEVLWEKGNNEIFGAHVEAFSEYENKDIIEYVIIDCSTDYRSNNGYCFAYFIGLDEGKHTVTVAPAENPKWPDDSNPFNPIGVNEIKSKPINSAEFTERNMEITLLEDTTYENGMLKLCYKVPDSKHNNTHLEAIFIDEDGHWLKIYQSTQERNLMHCFSPVNLLTSSLRITKASKLTVVIVERELTGYTVLASGQAYLELSALRAIEPEVDNGSEGSTSTMTVVGAAIAGIACLMALVAAAVMFVMKIKRDNDGLQYPLHRTNIEQDSSYIHGLDNPIPTM